MSDDPLFTARRRRERLSRVRGEMGGGVRKGDGELFDPHVYSEIREAASQWGQRLSDYTQATVLVPASLWSFSEFHDFPDLDISTLGVGNHRFFLFHSAAMPWMLNKIVEARLARSAGSNRISDRVIDRIVGVIAASGAYGVGIHLLTDVFQPKSVVFPVAGSLVEGTLVDDNVWLLANALYSFRLGNRMFALALGDDLPRVKAFVGCTIMDPIKQGLLDALPRRG